MKPTLIVFLIAGLSACAPPASDIAGRASVVDGDTIDIHGERIRLAGIDAPESGQRCRDASGVRYRCGKVSAFALADMLKGRTVQCVEQDRDRYKRIVAECFYSNGNGKRINVNAAMVANGQALAYRKYSTAYVSEEKEAKANRLGMWSGPFVAPWAWRKGER